MPDPVAPGAAGATAPDAASQDSAAADEARFAGVLARVLPGLLKQHLPSVLEPLVASRQAPAVEAPKVPAAGAAGGDLKSELDQLRAELGKERDGRAAERRQLREQQVFGDLKSELGKAGLRPEAVQPAAELLFHARKQVKIGVDGHVTFELGGQEYASLAEGVGAWRKTADAGLFVPAPGYGAPGAARRPGGPQAPPPRPATPAPGAPPGPRGQREDPLTKTIRDLGWG